MKRLSLFFAALFVAVCTFAQSEIVGPVAGTLTGGTPVLSTGITGSAVNRGGFALGTDGLYFCNNSTGRLFKADLNLAAIAAETDSIGKGYYMDIDDAGRFVIYGWTGGSSTLDYAQVYDANKQLIRNDSLGLNGRCDMPTMIGDMVNGRAAYFTASNSATAVLRHNVVDGVMTTVDTIPVGLTMAGNNSVAPLDVDHFYVQSRGNGLIYVDCSGDAPVVTPVKPEMFGVNNFTSAYGGKAFQMAGHTLYVMGTYKVGNYLGSFAVFDVTDPANPYVVCEETSTMGTSAMGTACVTFRVSVSNDVATIYEYACFSVRKYTMTLAPACFIKQGNEGAAWQQMAANGDVCSLKGTYLADSLYINTKADDEGAVKYTRADITYNGTVVVRDTVRFNYNPVTQAVSIDLLGTFVPTLTFNVKVPANTYKCYIAGTFSSWNRVRMKSTSDSTFTYTYRGFEVDNVAEVEYKYCAGPEWAYVEMQADGVTDISNRHWAENDVVLAWKAMPVVNRISYELNGGVTNDNGWTSKGAVMMEIQNDYNAQYSAHLAVVKQEDENYLFNVNNVWVSEAVAAGSDALVTGFFQNKTWSADQKCANLFLNNPKYQFLVDIIDHFRGTANESRGNEKLSEWPIGTADAYFRADVSGFMLNSPCTGGYPYTCNWAICGEPAAFLPVWKHAFANPEIVSGEFVLNAPYKEGFTFDGWYADSTFTGNKILSINDSTPTCTLYAKWIEYIMTIQEAIASDSLADVKTAGVVNFVDGKQVYIQDASGAVLVFMKANATCAVGDYIVVTGKNVIYNGAPEIKDGEVQSSEAGHALPAEVSASLSAVKGNMLGYFGKRIKVEGVVIASYDSNGNTYVTDGIDTVECYKVKANQTSFPVGTRVNLHLIGGAYRGNFQFVGPVEGIELAPLSGKDNYVYPARGENNEYTLTNKWLICDKLDNFSANKPASGDNMVRGMAAKDGKMYFVNREIGGFTVVDGATGEMLDPIIITGEHLFQAQDSAGEWKDAVTLKFNDVKFDNAGNCLIAGCAGSSVTHRERIMVYVVDLATGAATELINENLYDNDEFKEDTWRMDAIGVYGDVNSYAIIMFGNSHNKSLHAAYKWEINNGVADAAERIDLIINDDDNTYLRNADGTLTVEDYSACQVFPVDKNYFYWDHHSCRPTLFSMDGTFADDLKACPTGVTVVNNPGDTCKVSAGHNGICEFQIGQDYFVIMAATNNVENPAGSFALFKYANAAKAFAEMTPLWYFPAGGMGTQTNAYRTAVPTVEVKDDKATIYLYTGENGYGVYEMTGIASGIINTQDEVKAMKVIENGQVYIIRNGVRYTVLGAEVK